MSPEQEAHFTARLAATRAEIAKRDAEEVVQSDETKDLIREFQVLRYLTGAQA